MTSISLLPRTIKEQRKKKRRMLLISAGIFFLAILFALAFIYLTHMIRDVNNDIAAVENEAEQVESRIDELQPYRESYEQAAEMINLIEEDLGEVPNWQAVMVKLSESIPATSGVNALSMHYENDDEEADEDATGALNITAYTVDHADLTTWLETLSSAPLVEEVEYKFLEKTTYGEMELEAYAYEIEAEVIAEEVSSLLWGKEEKKNEE